MEKDGDHESNVNNSDELFKPYQEIEFRNFRNEIRAENRKNRLSITLWIIIPIFIIVLLPIILGYYLPTTFYFPIYKIYAFNILLVFYTTFMLWKVKIDGDLALAKFEKTMTQVVSKTKEEFKDLIEPLFESFAGLDDTREVIHRVFEDLEDDTSVIKYICYVGASSIHPTEDELSRVGTEKTESTEIAEKYDTKFKAIINNPGIKIERYIQLFPSDLISRNERDSKFVDNYLAWLHGQKKLLEDHPETYFLTATLRAPFWSSSKSSIITNQYVVDLYSEGKGGVSIKSRQIARQQYQNIVVEGIKKGKKKNRMELKPADLQKIINEINKK